MLDVNNLELLSEKLENWVNLIFQHPNLRDEFGHCVGKLNKRGGDFQKYY